MRREPTAFDLMVREFSVGLRPKHPDWALCSSSVCHWVDKYCYTYDPRTDAKVLRFRLFPRQVEFLRWLEGLEAAKEDGLCDKSRGVGVSFLCVAFALHRLLFRPAYKVGFGSRKLSYVDTSGNMDSLFEKARFILRKLPPWQMPDGFDWRSHASHCKLLNPENGSSITGEGGDEIGRGGRCSMYFVDEAAHLEHPDKADSSLTENTNVRVDVSTPNGSGNPFAIKRFSFPPHRVFTFHFKDDPRKDEEWERRTRKEKGLTVFASQYDIDYSMSLSGVCIPALWVRAAVGLKLLPTGRAVAGLDVGEEGNDLSVFTPRQGAVAKMPVSWAKLNTTRTAWRARDEAVRCGAKVLYYDTVGIGAGVKGTLQTAVGLPFEDVPVNVGEAPTESVHEDGETSQQKFVNFKAELWWSLRRRFERTYEYVAQGIKHPVDELISIPSCPQLIAELSLPLYEHNDRGKIAIESKRDLRARGVKSPDFADSLVLTETEYCRRLQDLWIA